MPNRQNHWVDAGYNPDGDFSPSEHVLNNYSDVKPINLLTISHPDKDHFDDIDRMVRALGEPRVLLRNKTVPDEVKFDSCTYDYQKVFRDLDKRYTQSVAWENDPKNPSCNGGVEVTSLQLDWHEAGDVNNSSIVMFYSMARTLLIFPGDIEESGWKALSAKYASKISTLTANTDYRILVAPHHGRGSGYSQKMFDDLRPSFVVISDDYGREPTDRKFREKPLGITFKSGVEKKFFSTKSNARVKIVVGPNGLSELTDN
jgi:beta-lactamase superfamily II metal-dependent hydrolase